MMIGDSELDIHRSHFIATGGLIIANIDEKVNINEINAIFDTLSKFTIFPKPFFDKICESGKVKEIFETSVATIIQQNPGERYSMFEFLVGIALSDNEIIKGEIELLYNIGEKIFGFSRKEIAQIIGSVTQKRFIPKLFL